MKVLSRIGLFFFVIADLAFSKLLPDEQNNVEIYQKCNPAVVNITTVALKQNFFFELYPQQGAGSGIVIRPDGYVLTNDHVAGNAQRINVTMWDKSEYPARLVGTDPDSDIAILKIDPKGKKLSALDFASEGLMAVGQKVLAIGNPFGLGGSLSVGVVSSLGRDIRASTERVIKDVIQTDAAINPGNSGGPLLDSAGKLVGLNTQILSTSGGSEGVGFAISIKTIRKIVPELIQYGQVLRPDLGFDGVGFPPAVFAALDIPTKYGVMITNIERGSSAAKAGLRRATQEGVIGFYTIPFGGDVIYKIDSTPITKLRDILDYIFEKKVGDSIVLHYFRRSEKRSVNIKLALPPGIRERST